MWVYHCLHSFYSECSTLNLFNQLYFLLHYCMFFERQTDQVYTEHIVVHIGVDWYSSCGACYNNFEGIQGFTLWCQQLLKYYHWRRPALYACLLPLFLCRATTGSIQLMWLMNLKQVQLSKASWHQDISTTHSCRRETPTECGYFRCDLSSTSKGLCLVLTSACMAPCMDLLSKLGQMMV